MVVLITDFLLAAWVVFWVIGLLGGSGVGKMRVWVMIVWFIEIWSGWKRGTYGRTGRMRALPF